MSCRSYRGRYLEGMHAERLAAARGLQPKENRDHAGRKGFQQRRADPTVRVRYAEPGSRGTVGA